VRAEDRELEGPELEREEATRDAAAHEQEELPAIGGEELRDVELAHRSTLFDAIRLVLAGENVTVSLLYLPQRETHALEALQAAVTGQDSVGEFVFAEDRKALLEQALAVLQQNVTHGDPAQLAALHAKFDELTEHVSELRERLVNLEDAQDDLFDEKRQYGGEETADAPDRDDKPAAAPEDASLHGPERPAAPPAPSTLEGPERPAAPPAPSTLHGPERPEAPPAPSTLEGPERPAEPPPPSTLHGDAPAEEARPRSELAAEAEAAEAQKPWWRRPFG
jgi:hypothetical protein